MSQADDVEQVMSTPFGRAMSNLSYRYSKMSVDDSDDDTEIVTGPIIPASNSASAKALEPNMAPKAGTNRRSSASKDHKGKVSRVPRLSLTIHTSNHLPFRLLTL